MGPLEVLPLCLIICLTGKPQSSLYFVSLSVVLRVCVAPCLSSTAINSCFVFYLVY